MGGQGILTEKKSRRTFSAGGMAFTPAKWMEQVWKDSSLTQNQHWKGHRMCLGKEAPVDTQDCFLKYNKWG